MFNNNFGNRIELYLLRRITARFFLNKGAFKPKLAATKVEKKHKLNFKNDKILVFLNRLNFKVVR